GGGQAVVHGRGAEATRGRGPSARVQRCRRDEEVRARPGQAGAVDRVTCLGSLLDTNGNNSMIEVKVPDIGDFQDVPVIEVLVKAGDTVAVDDSLVTLESDKATMDVPS